MKPYKCRKAEVNGVFANALRNAPAKIQRNKKQTIEAEKKKKMTKRVRLEVVATMKKTWHIFSNLFNLFLFCCVFYFAIKN